MEREEKKMQVERGNIICSSAAVYKLKIKL